MQAYKIVDWVRQYEVTVGNHAVDKYCEELPPVEKLRKSPLPYVRVENTGHGITPTAQEIIDKCPAIKGMFEMAVWGLYGKLLILAANQPRGFRGWILDQKQRPMHAQQIGRTLGIFCTESLNRAIGILTSPEVGLLELCEFRQTCARLRNNAQDCASFKKETESESDTKQEKDSRCAPVDSDSAIAEAREAGLKRTIANLFERRANFNPKTRQGRANNTTVKDIFDQLETAVRSGTKTTEIFAAVADEARTASKMSHFVTVMESEQFGYVPEKRGWFRKARQT